MFRDLGNQGRVLGSQDEEPVLPGAAGKKGAALGAHEEDEIRHHGSDPGVEGVSPRGGIQ